MALFILHDRYGDMAAFQTEDIPSFPTLDPGVTLLSTDGRATGPLQSLVLDHVLLKKGTVAWVDARDNATTTSLVTLAPSRRTLQRIQVARAFTPFQHYSLLEELPTVTDDETTLIVVPAIEWFYTTDTLRAGEGETMLREALESLQELAARGVPVLVSRDAADGLGECVEPYCDVTLACERTQFGPRFVGEEFETLLFEDERGTVQTTLAFWRQVLQRRHAAHFPGSATEVTSIGTD